MSNFKREHHKHYSQSLCRDMEYKVYGESGHPVMVFPPQDGRFFDYENFGMIEALAPWIESGKIRVISVDSVDKDSWSAVGGNIQQRIDLQERWFNYIINELIPVVSTPGETFIATGCSMGAFHAANFFFRRPDLFDTTISLSGFYHADFFFGLNYNNSMVYDNSPLDFLPNMPDNHPYIELYRKRNIIICVGQGAWEEDMIDSTRRLEKVLQEKGIPAWIDYWGHDVNHDWPWWLKQIVYFIPKVLE